MSPSVPSLRTAPRIALVPKEYPGRRPAHLWPPRYYIRHLSLTITNYGGRAEAAESFRRLPEASGWYVKSFVREDFQGTSKILTIIQSFLQLWKHARSLSRNSRKMLQCKRSV